MYGVVLKWMCIIKRKCMLFFFWVIRELCSNMSSRVFYVFIWISRLFLLLTFKWFGVIYRNATPIEFPCALQKQMLPYLRLNIFWKPIVTLQLIQKPQQRTCISKQRTNDYTFHNFYYNSFCGWNTVHQNICHTEYYRTFVHYK